MKKLGLCLTAALLAASMLCSAGAADAKVTVFRQPVIVEGHTVICLNEQGAKVPYLQSDGTTYIPIRTAGEWMGKNVSWDSGTATVTLSGRAAQNLRDERDYASAPSELPQNGFAVMASVRQDISVVLDGEKQTFQNVKGKPVYPLMYQNVTYLPLRSIGELLHMEVHWWSHSELDRQTIYIRSALSDEQKEQSKTYINELLRQCSQLSAAADTLRVSKDKQAMLDNAAAVCAVIDRMEAVAAPQIKLYEDQAAELHLNLEAVRAEVAGFLQALNSGDETAAAAHLDREFQVGVQQAENAVVTMKRYYLQEPTDHSPLD